MIKYFSDEQLIDLVSGNLLHTHVHYLKRVITSELCDRLRDQGVDEPTIDKVREVNLGCSGFQQLVEMLRQVNEVMLPLFTDVESSDE